MQAIKSDARNTLTMWWFSGEDEQYYYFALTEFGDHVIRRAKVKKAVVDLVGLARHGHTEHHAEWQKVGTRNVLSKESQQL